MEKQTLPISVEKVFELQEFVGTVARMTTTEENTIPESPADECANNTEALNALIKWARRLTNAS